MSDAKVVTLYWRAFEETINRLLQMVDSNRFQRISEVAHVFRSEDNVALQRENRQLRAELEAAHDKLELARICSQKLHAHSLNDAIDSYDDHVIRCNCYVCYRRRNPTGFGGRGVINDCKLAKAVEKIISDNSLILTEHALWRQYNRDKCDKVRKAWYWQDMCGCDEDPPIDYCPIHTPFAHVYRVTNVYPSVDFKWGRLAWEAKTVEEVKPLLNLLKQLRSHVPQAEDLVQRLDH